MSSSYAGSDYDSAEARPDKPLVVKCSYEGVNKRITFASSRTCSYDLLRQKVEQCFSLSQTTYAITYTDDDGEITIITTETDLTEAIRYFCPSGYDDAPLSSAASILSGRSFGRGKITLRVKITVDYDGPSLSDTSSLASMEEYRSRNSSDNSLSLSAASSLSYVEPDDDQVTVSSKDTGSRPRSKISFFRSRGTKTVVPGMGGRKREKGTEDEWEEETVSSAPRTVSRSGVGSSLPSIQDDEEGVFERLRQQEEDREGGPSASSTSLQHWRGTAWLREQNERSLHIVGRRSARSESIPDSISLSDSAPGDDDTRSIMNGELALEQGNGGRFYYTYTTGGSSAPPSVDSGYDIDPTTDDEWSLEDSRQASRPVSRDMTTSDGYPVHRAPSSSSSSSSHRSPGHRSYSEPIVNRDDIMPDIPEELLPFITAPPAPPKNPTDCSNCGASLETLKYVCATCGEKEPPGLRGPSRTANSAFEVNGKGKGKQWQSPGSSTTTFVYPPSAHPPHPSISPSVSSWTLVAESDNPFHDSNAINMNYSSQHKPLPALPGTSPSSYSPSCLTIPGMANGSSSSLSSQGEGYELCFNCIAVVGVAHAVEASVGPGSSPMPDWPPSPEDAQRALSQWKRTASRKGHTRHAYIEKVWGPRGWDNVEHDEQTSVKCSTCSTMIVGKRYKCTTCDNLNLCKACYSQVHEIHPLHPFLVLNEKPLRTRSEPLIEHPALSPDETGELPMTHIGVKCAHCLQDIVGARFHCAICPSIDICSNCESAGLPGNLDSSDDSHNSSHIMIKIPYPLPIQELEYVSRHAQHLWGQDAVNLPESTRGSSSDIGTVMGAPASTYGSEKGFGHHLCDSCRKTITGVRYQCGSCPSKPRSFNLCEECEASSYAKHDPMHIFFKLPRPVDRPLENYSPILPPLYREPAGPPGGTINRDNPKEYLEALLHQSAICDRCMVRISGEWFRCVYCAKDLCDGCEAVDTHNDKHFFMVFKAPVDMQVFRRFARLDSQDGVPHAVIPYDVYTH